MCTELESRLLDKLPHGSGINGSWSIQTNKKGILLASNYYEAMNESGMYCHYYDFTAKVKYNGIGKYTECPLCHTTGVRTLSEMKVYRPNMADDELIIWLQSTGIGEVVNNQFACNYCNGFGWLPLHEFEFISLNFHGQKEHTCCGYDLKNYISDTIAEVLTIDN
jgi:hypothetical protein